MSPVHKPSVQEINAVFRHFRQILRCPPPVRGYGDRRITHGTARLNIHLSAEKDYVCLQIMMVREGLLRRPIIPAVRWCSLNAAKKNWSGHLTTSHAEHPLDLRDLILLTALINIPTA